MIWNTRPLIHLFKIPFNYFGAMLIRCSEFKRIFIPEIKYCEQNSSIPQPVLRLAAESGLEYSKGDLLEWFDMVGVSCRTNNPRTASIVMS